MTRRVDKQKLFTFNCNEFFEVVNCDSTLSFLWYYVCQPCKFLALGVMSAELFFCSLIAEQEQLSHKRAFSDIDVAENSHFDFLLCFLTAVLTLGALVFNIVPQIQALLSELKILIELRSLSPFLLFISLIFFTELLL